MKKTAPISRHSRLSAGVASAVLSFALISGPAFAQAADDAEAEPEIVITGTLIKDPNLKSTTPVLATTAEEVELRQANVAEEVLREIPGVTPNIGSAVNNGNGGSSFVDLRGLGNNRNIALLDGRRVVPSSLLGAFDLNNVPLALVERTDVLTGAAVTTYGADAIAGVVNFITKRDFAGMELNGGASVNEKGDGPTYRVDLTLGANFDDGRGNAVMSIGYQKSDPVYQGDRDFSTFNVDSFSGAPGGSGTSVPVRVSGTRPLVGGVISTDPTVANGGVRQLNATTGFAVPTFAFFNFNPYNIFQTPFTRYNMYAAARYEVSDNIEVYTRGLFSKNSVKTIIAPSGVFGSTVTINLNNPYLPAGLRNQYCAFNVAAPGSGLYTPRFTPAECAAAALATGPADPRYKTVTGTLARRFVETGTRNSDFQTTVFDFEAGLRGQISDDISWDVRGSYGKSEKPQVQTGYVLTSRVRDALLANNTTTCISGNAGCVPLNAFGPEGSITPAMFANLLSPSTVAVNTSLGQVHAEVGGKTGLTLPWAEDQVSFAVGAEYRKYSASQVSDTLSKSGDLGGAGGAAPDIAGKYEVKETFGELNLPLVQDKAFFDSLSLKAGIRYSKYKALAPTAGNPTNSATTYAVGGAWEPGAGVKFRANYARAVRAPNIGELFNPLQTGLTSLATDPCAGAAPLTNATLRAVCIAQGAPAGSIGSILNPTASQANSTGGGNLLLKPEKAKTLTAGVQWQPTFAKDLSISLDYYNIKVSDAITTPTAQDVISSCFGTLTAASATDPNCIASIRRNPITGGLDGDQNTTKGLFQNLSNLGKIQAKGLDLAINFKTGLGFADLVTSFQGNYILDAKFQATSTSVNRECVGLFSSSCGATGSGSLQPKYQFQWRNTLKFEGGIDVSLLWRHLDKMRQEDGDSFVGTIGTGAGVLSGRSVDFNKIKAYDYFDLALRFAVSDNLTLIGSVSNLLDKQPPVVGASVGTTAFNSGNTYPSTYDALGRRYGFTAKISF